MDIRNQNGCTYSQTNTTHRNSNLELCHQWLLSTALILLALLMLAISGKLLYDSAQEVIGAFSSVRGLPHVDILITDPASKRRTDKDAPVLYGVHDLTVYAGENLSYLSDVSVLDACDSSPTVTVDSSAVDLKTPGTYKVIYTARDSSGNACQTAAAVTVLEKATCCVEEAEIYAAADALLEELICPDMTAQEQVETIYNWAQSSIRYSSPSIQTGWLQAAYQTITKRSGDGFGFFAATKLLFQRLGIPNIDVCKVKQSQTDTDHFWSLVSIDGGKNWYHFDAAPRAGRGDSFCLVTDLFLDTYSDAHRGSHNRDSSRYPATPCEDLIKTPDPSVRCGSHHR